jgi:uncharacterized protein (DUF2235 family)
MRDDVGIVENVAALWLVLCGTYEKGDKIFIFGFSRGAYTARILASLVTTFGLLVSSICSFSGQF